MTPRTAALGFGTALTLALLAACAPTEPRVSTGAIVSAAAAPEVGRHLNQARSRQGLAPLAASPAVADAALAQARHVASTGRLSHRSAGGGTVKDRVEARGFDACLAAENLAARQPDAATVSASWLSSPGHRRNMLLPRATHYGAASATTADGTRYWVLALAGRC